MQRPPAPFLVLAGLLFGAALAAGGWWAGSKSGSDVSATTPTSEATGATLPPEATGRSGEVSLGPTTLRPLGIAVEGAELTFSYELVSSSPGPVGTFTRPDDDAVPVAAPETWVLVTQAGEIPGQTSSVRARTARFQVGNEFDPETITALRLERWRVRLPLLHRLDIGQDDTSEHRLDVDTSVTLRRVLEQTNNTLVQFLVSHPGDLFTAGGGFGATFEAQPQVRGVGSGWTNVGPINGGVQLTFVGDRLPDPIPVTIRTHDWVVIERPVEIDVEGLPDA